MIKATTEVACLLTGSWPTLLAERFILQARCEADLRATCIQTQVKLSDEGLFFLSHHVNCECSLVLAAETCSKCSNPPCSADFPGSAAARPSGEAVSSFSGRHLQANTEAATGMVDMLNILHLVIAPFHALSISLCLHWPCLACARHALTLPMAISQAFTSDQSAPVTHKASNPVEPQGSSLPVCRCPVAAHRRGLHVVAAAGNKVVSKEDNQGIVQFQPFKEVSALAGPCCCLLFMGSRILCP